MPEAPGRSLPSQAPPSQEASPEAADRPSPRVVNALLRRLATWLDPGDSMPARSDLGRWSPATWVAFRRVVAMHGLAGHLAPNLGRLGLTDAIPIEVRAWLTEQHGLNAARVRRMHGELAAILERAAAAGVEMMPLKGSLLTTQAGVDPGRRPMADLDLLVRPADHRAARAVLEALGYRRERIVSRRPGPDSFVDRGGGVVVSYDGEHPDNPRRVELHVNVMRHLWGWNDRDDLTRALWAGAAAGEVVGRPAMVPRHQDVFVHLAIHASSDLLMGRGRLVQWLDLGLLASRGEPPDEWPHPRLAFPSLQLAARAMPRAMAGVYLESLDRRVPAALARWAAGVPLDGRCGLVTGPPSLPDSALAARLARWRPTRWRLAVAYGDRPLPLLLARHALRLVGRLRRVS